MKKLAILILIFANFNLFAKEITSREVYVKIKFVIDELELIRKEMGKLKIKRSNLDVKNASPREVFFQALTLFTKANNFTFEYLRVERHKINIPKDIKPKDVYKVLTKTLELISRVKEYLKIKEKSIPIKLNKDKTATDVFRESLYANRLISTLLEKNCFHDKVFSQMNLAINYTSLILAHLKADRESRNLYEPKYERYKTHIDVYNILVDNFEIIERIYKKLHLNMLNLNLNSMSSTNIIPSDVYNMTSLVVSELSYIHSSLHITKEPYNIIYPINVLPSNVYQKAKLLKDKLNSIKSILDEKK